MTVQYSTALAPASLQATQDVPHALQAATAAATIGLQATQAEPHAAQVATAIVVPISPLLVPADRFDYSAAMRERLHHNPQLARIGAHLAMLRRARLGR